MIEKSLSVAKHLADDVHLHVMAFNDFGKGLIKTFKVSPDAFIQASLQLAHLRVSVTSRGTDVTVKSLEGPLRR